ncbi:hypothetical protein HDV06_006454 [Boothiomyces sp. JEL0866]|nr:hypothetical protein HDV06_001235 [Boothiomyces sp. JEL0866]KAJ3324561.1 hypothetical protein HDV06_006454 [Boothiomyces sp. JEL0866]
MLTTAEITHLSRTSPVIYEITDLSRASPVIYEITARLAATITAAANTSSTPLLVISDIQNSSSAIYLVLFGIIVPIIAIIIATGLLCYKYRRRTRSITPDLNAAPLNMEDLERTPKKPKSSLSKLHKETSNNTMINIEKEESVTSIKSAPSSNFNGRPSSSPFANLRELENVGGFIRFKRDTIGFDNIEVQHLKELFQKDSIKELRSKGQMVLPSMHALKDTPSNIQKTASAEPLTHSGRTDSPQMVPLKESKIFKPKKTISTARFDNDLVIDNLDDDHNLPPVFQITKKIEKNRLAPLDVPK